MMTEKIRVRASSVMSSVADTSATPMKWRVCGISDRIGRSVPFGSVMKATEGSSGSTAAIRRGFLLACASLAAALPIAARSVAQAPSTAVSAFALVVYAVGAVVCHQLPDRSFHLLGRQLPVCARCTGIYAGAAVAAILATFASDPKTV